MKLKAIRLKEKDNLYSKVEFKKPFSILTSIIELQKDREIKNKMDKIRKNFKLDKFLEKEKKRGVDVDGLGRRKSFLNFIQYTEKKSNLNDYLKDLEKKNSLFELKGDDFEKNNKMKKIFELINVNKNEENAKNNLNISENETKSKKDFDTNSKLEEQIEDKYQHNISFLSRDSNLTIDKNISLDDINILPNEIKEMKIFVNTATTNENIKKIWNQIS